MTEIALYFLGSPRLERNGALIELDTRKAVALLAYLVVTGAGHTRDALAALLWPELDQSRARAALRRTLSSLRQAFGNRELQITREAVAIGPKAGIWADVTEFRRLLAELGTHDHPPDELCAHCLELLRQAAELYRDDFLAGFGLRDSLNFDEWQYFQGETLRREFAGALEKLVSGHSALGLFEPAISYARRWLALDPLREEAHRQLMQLYAWAGQRSAALRQYRECVRILEAELGVPPLPETTALYERIQSGDLPPAPKQPAVAHPQVAHPQVAQPRTPAPPHPRSPAPLPLVGRSHPWATLQQAYARGGDDGYFVVVEGEAGIGKTRLAEEFLAHARAAGARTIVARCYEGETALAYGPFVEALRAALGQADSAQRLSPLPAHWLSEAARLLPELASLLPDLPPAPPLESPGAQSRFFEGVAQVLVALCHNSVPGILFLDDLHWADAASLDLLTYLVRRPGGRSLFILATWRAESVLAEHRLRQLVTAVQRAQAGTRIELSRLQADDVANLVHTAGVTLPPEMDRQLYRETEGLPFFVVAYLAAAAEDETGRWAIPPSVRDLLHARLAAVDETGRQLLQTAAVIGRSFDFDSLREASGRSDEETIAALESLIAQGLVAEQKADQDLLAHSPTRPLAYDFSHEKLRTQVYEETSFARRRLLHRRVADALANQTPGYNMGSVAGHIAHHLRLAGQEAGAADYYRQAGDYARSLFANAEALAHFHTALALGHPEAAALHEAMGDLQVLQGEYGAALNSYETAAALGANGPSARLEHKLGQLHHRCGRWELAQSQFETALSGSPEPGFRARVYADWSRTAHHRGETEQAQALAEQALALAETAGDDQALAQVHNILGILARSRQDLSTARHHLERSLALAETMADPHARIAALNNLALACSASGDTEQAIELLQTALELGIALGDRHRQGALHNNLADLLHAAGRHEAAMEHLKQAVAILADVGIDAGAWQPEIWKLTEW